MSAALSLSGVVAGIGPLTILQGVDLEVGEGEVVVVLGANGAGKTTLFNTITGFVTPTAGQVVYLGQTITALPTFRRARQGLARSFQIPRLMPSLTVWENVLLASRHGRQADRAEAHTAWVLEALGLAPMWSLPASRLSPGHQRQLEFARVLGLQPTVVLLDEVMAGMTAEERETVRAVVRRLPEFGVAGTILVEHVIAAVVDLCDRMVVLDFGRIIAEGPPREVLANPDVVKAYLGEAL